MKMLIHLMSRHLKDMTSTNERFHPTLKSSMKSLKKKGNQPKTNMALLLRWILPLVGKQPL